MSYAGTSLNNIKKIALAILYHLLQPELVYLKPHTQGVIRDDQWVPLRTRMV